jgi:hypothetical protein
MIIKFFQINNLIKFAHVLIENMISIKGSNYQIMLKIISENDVKEKKKHKKELSKNQKLIQN